MFTKLGGAGDRFGDDLRVDCANLQGHNQISNTQFTSPINAISKSGVYPELARGTSFLFRVNLAGHFTGKP